MSGISSWLEHEAKAECLDLRQRVRELEAAYDQVQAREEMYQARIAEMEAEAEEGKGKLDCGHPVQCIEVWDDDSSGDVVCHEECIACYQISQVGKWAAGCEAHIEELEAEIARRDTEDATMLKWAVRVVQDAEETDVPADMFRVRQQWVLELDEALEPYLKRLRAMRGAS